MGRRQLAAVFVAPAITVIGAIGVVDVAPAGACGGLFDENGTIQLEKTTTLAAYTKGVERYVTAFEFAGQGKSVGSLVPLPDIPTKVEAAGDWTLQRLQREVAPPVLEESFGDADRAAAPASAEVILETQIEALDITVLKGGGDEVGKWAEDNGFLLTPDAPEMLDFYAARSPIFMAAKFDAQRAKELGQGTGDSTAIMATIPTDQPWVPLRILGLGLDADTQVEADVFMLTDDEPGLLAGGPGVDVARSEAASDLLLSDLRSDKGMGWVPEHMWLSYLQVNTPAGDLDFDLAASTSSGARPSLKDVGIDEPSDAVRVHLPTPGPALWPLGLGGLAGLLALGVVTRGRRGGPAVAS